GNGLRSGDEREDRKTCHDQKADARRGGQDQQPLVPPRLLALSKLVVADTDDARGELQKRVALSVAGRPRVRCERFGTKVEQGRRKKLSVRAKRAVTTRLGDDEALDAIALAERCEGPDFLVHPARLRAVCRT